MKNIFSAAYKRVYSASEVGGASEEATMSPADRNHAHIESVIATRIAAKQTGTASEHRSRAVQVAVAAEAAKRRALLDHDLSLSPTERNDAHMERLIATRVAAARHLALADESEAVASAAAAVAAAAVKSGAGAGASKSSTKPPMTPPPAKPLAVEIKMRTQGEPAHAMAAEVETTEDDERTARRRHHRHHHHHHHGTPPGTPPTSFSTSASESSSDDGDDVAAASWQEERTALKGERDALSAERARLAKENEALASALRTRSTEADSPPCTPSEARAQRNAQRQEARAVLMDEEALKARERIATLTARLERLTSSRDERSARLAMQVQGLTDRLAAAEAKAIARSASESSSSAAAKAELDKKVGRAVNRAAELSRELRETQAELVSVRNAHSAESDELRAQAHTERDEAVAARDGAVAARDAAVAQRDAAAGQRNVEVVSAQAARDEAATAERKLRNKSELLEATLQANEAVMAQRYSTSEAAAAEGQRQALRQHKAALRELSERLENVHAEKLAAVETASRESAEVRQQEVAEQHEVAMRDFTERLAKARAETAAANEAGAAQRFASFEVAAAERQRETVEQHEAAVREITERLEKVHAAEATALRATLAKLIASGAASSSSIGSSTICTGLLLAKGAILKRWQKKNFSLSDDGALHDVSAEGTKRIHALRRAVVKIEATVEVAEEGASGCGEIFALTITDSINAGRTQQLRAQSRADYKRWVDAFREADWPLTVVTIFSGWLVAKGALKRVTNKRFALRGDGALYNVSDDVGGVGRVHSLRDAVVGIDAVVGPLEEGEEGDEKTFALTIRDRVNGGRAQTLRAQSRAEWQLWVDAFRSAKWPIVVIDPPSSAEPASVAPSLPRVHVNRHGSIDIHTTSVATAPSAVAAAPRTAAAAVHVNRSGSVMINARGGDDQRLPRAAAAAALPPAAAAKRAHRSGSGLATARRGEAGHRLAAAQRTPSPFRFPAFTFASPPALAALGAAVHANRPGSALVDASLFVEVTADVTEREPMGVHFTQSQCNRLVEAVKEKEATYAVVLTAAARPIVPAAVVSVYPSLFYAKIGPPRTTAVGIARTKASSFVLNAGHRTSDANIVAESAALDGRLAALLSASNSDASLQSILAGTRLPGAAADGGRGRRGR